MMPLFNIFYVKAETAVWILMCTGLIDQGTLDGFIQDFRQKLKYSLPIDPKGVPMTQKWLATAISHVTKYLGE